MKDKTTTEIMEVLKDYDFTPLELLRAALDTAKESGLMSSLHGGNAERRDTVEKFFSLATDYDIIQLWRVQEYPTLEDAKKDGAVYHFHVPRGTDLVLIETILSAAGECLSFDRNLFKAVK